MTESEHFTVRTFFNDYVYHINVQIGNFKHDFTTRKALIMLMITLLTLSSTEDFSSNNLTYMDVYLLLTKTLKRDYFHREKEN